RRRNRPSFMACAPWPVDRGRPVRHTTRQPAREKQLMSSNSGLPADAPKAPAVEDRGSGVRITALKTFRVGHKVFVRIDSNRKVSGWGEVSALEPSAAEALAKSLYELLDGENPTRVEHLWQKLYRAHRDMRGGPFMVHTIAGLDMALWDLTGKLY